jgi:hypothetical protein
MKYSNFKRSLFLSVFLIAFILVSQTSSAQLFSDTYEMNASVDENTSVIFLGNIACNGSFQAVSLDSTLESFNEYLDMLQLSIFPSDLSIYSSWDHLYGFPVFSQTVLPQATAYVINTSYLSSIDLNTMADLIEAEEQAITSYENVSIVVTDGLALVGSNQRYYEVHHQGSYGIGGLFQFSFSEEFPSTGLAIISDEQSTLTSATRNSFLYPFESIIEINQGNQTVQRISNAEQILLLNTDEDLILSQNSLIHFYPLLEDSDAAAEASISVSQVDTAESYLSSLINNLNNSLTALNDSSVQNLISNNNLLTSFAPLVSNVFNSGIIILNLTQPLTIDDKSININSIIAGRGPSFSMTIDQQASSPVRITGDSSLLFLDDHIYNDAGEPSGDGITFPLWSIIFWLGAIVSIIFFIFFKKQHQIINQNEVEPTLLKNGWVRFLSIIFLLLICFIILDVSFSLKFGLSFLTILGMQTNSMVIGIFLLVQILILLLVFVMYALPIQLIHDIICKTMIKNKFQKLTKIVIAIPFFWLGIQLYLLVFFNIILSFLNPSSIL